MNTFFSRHRKNTITLVNDKFPDNTEIIRFKPHGMIGQVVVTDEVAERMRKHKLFESPKSERGVFYENKPVVAEINNIVQGPKGAGHVIMDDSTEIPSKSDKEKIVKAPKKKKKKSSKKK